MEAFFVAFTTVALAEVGDRTQVLSLVLAARFRKPWPMIAAILLATVGNHLVAGYIGLSVGRLLSPPVLDGAVGVSLIAMAVWALSKEEPGGEPATRAGAFVTTLIAFFVAEIGDKTQIATLALAAGYHNLLLVVAGSTSGMLAANVPVVFAGAAFASRIPVRTIHLVASALFAVIGIVFVTRAILHAVTAF